jgi:glucose 1-dehydrogenase
LYQGFEETVQCYGQIDILINNVGIQQAVSFQQTIIEEWYKITGVDLTRPIVYSREAVKHMEKQQHEVANNAGCIINISSVHQTIPKSHYIPCASSRAGIEMMTKRVRQICR